MVLLDSGLMRLVGQETTWLEPGLVMEREQRKPRERQDTKQFLAVQLEAEKAMFNLKNKIF